MSSQKISQLNPATTTSGSDLYPLVQGGNNFSITFSLLQAALAAATTPGQLPLITLAGDVTGSSSGGNIPTSIAATTVTAKLLTGFVVGANTSILATDSIIAAFGKIQAQINNVNTTGVFSVSAAGPLSSTGGQNPTISIPSTTGSGAVVQALSPTLTTPNLGTPSSVILTNGTALPLTTGVVGILPIANGGTGQISASAARTSAGLNIDQRTAISNSSYAALATDRYIGQIGTLTGPITITLPPANSVNAGQVLIIQDESGTVTTSNYINLSPAGTNNLNGANSAKSFRTPYQRIQLFSDGVSNWYYQISGISQGGTGTTTIPTNGQLLIGNGSNYTVAALTAGTNIGITNGSGSISIGLVGTIGTGNGGTGVTAVTTTPTATSFAGWDANSNLSANLILEGFTTTVTSAGTTTLTVASTQFQYFTGTSTQTVVLPVASTLVNGTQFSIINASTGIVTVNTSGGATLQAMGASSRLTATVVNSAGGTGASSWSFTYNAASPTYTQGSVFFANANGVISQDNSQFFWNDTTHRLGIGTATPAQALDVTGTGQVRAGQILGASTTPTIAYGAAAGVGPTTAALIGNQMAFYLQFTTGTLTTTGTVATITVPVGAGTYGAPPILIPQNAAAAAAVARIGITLINNTSWSISVFTTALTASTAYAYYVSCPAAF